MTLFVVFVCSKKGQVNNMNTIQDLYYGRISPYEMSISTAPEYQKLKALASKNEDLLKRISQTYPPSQSGICSSPASGLA